MAELRTIVYADQPLVYTLTRKRVKNLNLRVRPDGSVAVSAPPRVSVSQIDAFVLSKACMVLSAQARFLAQASQVSAPRQYVSGEQYPFLGDVLTLCLTPGPKDSIAREGSCLLLTMKDPENIARRARLVERHLDRLCRETFEAALAAVYPPFGERGVPMPVLRIRRMKSRWGSCFYTRGIITLNRQLLAAPMSCIEYVAAHELCHFLVPNHSRAFYELLSSILPDWKFRRETLNDNAARWL